MPLVWSDTPTDRLQLGDIALDYACWGPPPDQAPTIVLLHEGLGSVAQWKGIPAALAHATGLGVLAYSRRGYGASDPVPLPRPLDYMTREATEVLPEVLNAAGVRNCLLLGHSDGASIAAIYAGSVFDRRLRGLILIAPHFFTEPMGLAAIRAAGLAYRTGDLKPRLARYHADVDGAFFGWHDAWTDPGFEDWNIADVIDHLRVPVLAIQGSCDPYGTMAQIAEVEERCYAPVETLILKGAGHAPHLAQADTCLAGMSAFCARLMRLEAAQVSLG